jgi:hypothetical protein
MGAEVFLTVDRASGRPLRAELVGGNSFPAEYFRSEIERIEEGALELGLRINIEQSAYARILVVGGDICFLVFPSDAEPQMRGIRAVLTDREDGSIVSFVDQGVLVCVDGWMKTDVEDSEWFLVAEPDDKA